MTEPIVESGVGELPTLGVADPRSRSDTINPTGETPEVPVAEAEITEAEVIKLKQQLEEQRRIQAAEAEITEAEASALKQQLEEQRRIQAGLDRVVSRATAQDEAAQQAIKDLEARLAIYNTVDGTNNDVITDYINQLEAVATERDQWQQQAEEAIRSESRVRIVAAEFPGLAPLIDARALPQAADDEAFRTSLLQLQDSFASAADVLRRDQLRGVKPPASPPASTPTDTNAIKRQMLAAEPGSEEFNRARDQWYAALGVSSD